MSFRKTLYSVIFKSDTKAGQIFDILLIIAILLSVLTVLLDSVSVYHHRYEGLLNGIEWFFTFLFTLEYVLRLYSSPLPSRYAYSFYGIIDLLAILPSYVSLFFPSGHYFVVLRILRVLRIFRILKLTSYLRETNLLGRALWASRRKIMVFIFTVATLVVIIGALMFIVEKGQNGFSSIPQSIYWAVVTLTTVGYGDISPATNLGKSLAALVMILGYGIIAVPTGIVTVEISQAQDRQRQARQCPACHQRGHELNAQYCQYCGSSLLSDTSRQEI